MADTKNALADLANDLLNDLEVANAVAGFDQTVWNRIRKAQRIVAELAKLDGVKEYIYAGNTVFANTKEFVDVFKHCRTIAKEGASDGK